MAPYSFEKDFLLIQQFGLKKCRCLNDLKWWKNEQFREVVGSMGEVVRIGKLLYFLAFSRYISHFPVSFFPVLFPVSCFLFLLTLEQLFALVLYFRYPRVSQTLLEYTAVCYHLVYTTINSVWGFLNHLSYLISYSLASVTCLH